MNYRDGNETFELPSLTLALQDRYEAARSCADRREAASLKLALMVEALGEDYVRSRCGSCDVEGVDLAELHALFIDVSMAYGLHGFKEVEAALSSLMPLVDKLDRLNALAGKSKARQGFRGVV